MHLLYRTLKRIRVHGDIHYVTCTYFHCFLCHRVYSVFCIHVPVHIIYIYQVIVMLALTVLYTTSG